MGGKNSEAKDFLLGSKLCKVSLGQANLVQISFGFCLMKNIENRTLTSLALTGVYCNRLIHPQVNLIAQPIHTIKTHPPETFPPLPETPSMFLD